MLCLTQGSPLKLPYLSFLLLYIQLHHHFTQHCLEATQAPPSLGPMQESGIIIKTNGSEYSTKKGYGLLWN